MLAILIAKSSYQTQSLCFRVGGCFLTCFQCVHPPSVCYLQSAVPLLYPEHHLITFFSSLKISPRDFPSGPVAETLHSQWMGA